MKIATYNVNSIRQRIGIVSQWLDQERPDVFCMQETKVQDKDFPVTEFEKLGYQCTYRGQKTFNGVAILTPKTPSNVRYGFSDGDETMEPRMITLTIGGITVVNNYVPQGQDPASDKFQIKLQWFKRLRSFLELYYDPQQPLVWLGDLNIAPEPIDVHDPKGLYGHVCYHPQVHEALRHVQDWGLVDVFRRHDPEPQRYTFWDYRIPKAVERKLGWRIDHIFATKPLAELSRSCWIDIQPRLKEKTSDHTIVVAEFEV